MKALVAGLFLFLGGLAGGAACADPVEDFYHGRTLTILLGHPPGGSYDMYARLSSDYFRKYLPGQPNVVVEYRPGGGGVVAASYFYANSPRDGGTIALLPETLAYTQILEPKVGRWKMQEMAYVGSFAPVNTAFIARKSAPAQSIEALKQVQTIMGCTGVSSQGYQYPSMLKNLAGFKFKIICGYPGSAEILLALTKGEIDMTSAAWNNVRIAQRDEFAHGDLHVLIQAGLQRNPELANVPLMQELVPEGEAREIVEFASAGAGIGRALLAPPGVPADRLTALRAAFDQMVKDPALVQQAAQRGLELDPKPGAEVQKIALAIVGASPTLIEKAIRAQAE